MGDRKASEQVTYSAAQLRKGVTEGDVKEAHPHAGMVPGSDALELLNSLATAFEPKAHPNLEAVEESELYQTILRNEATNALTEAVEAGNVSQMQYGVGMVNHDNDAQDADTRTWLRQQLATQAGVFLVTGGMGAGKTDWGLELADEFHMATRGRVATNLESAAEKNREIEHVGGYDELETLFSGCRDDVIMVLDETGQGLTGYGDDQQQARALANTLKLVRKGDAPAGTYRVIVLIGQTVRDASRDLRRLVAQTGHFFHKPRKKTVEVYGHDLIKSEIPDAKPSKKITGVPQTRFTFDTTEGPEFDMSGALDDGGDSGELSGRDRDIRTAIRAVESQGLGYREAADLTDFGKDWVGERVREWRKNGKHVDIVGFEASKGETDGQDTD
jgi:hypothetical protein